MRADRIGFAALLIFLPIEASAQTFIGQASITDGDTVEIHGVRLRLWGIDAPESVQLCRGADSMQYRCGAEAANALDAFVARRPLDCVQVDVDRKWHRPVVTCSVAGTDLGEWLVGNGHALDWPQYSKGAYRQFEQEAKNNERGMWRGSFVEPWRFRPCWHGGGIIAECSDDATVSSGFRSAK